MFFMQKKKSRWPVHVHLKTDKVDFKKTPWKIYSQRQQNCNKLYLVKKTTSLARKGPVLKMSELLFVLKFDIELLCNLWHLKLSIRKNDAVLLVRNYNLHKGSDLSIKAYNSFWLSISNEVCWLYLYLCLRSFKHAVFHTN